MANQREIAKKLRERTGLNRVIVAIDTPDFDKCQKLIALLSPNVAGIKLSSGIDRFGIARGKALRTRTEVLFFCDLKVHDTVSTTVARLKEHAGFADISTIHTSTSIQSLHAAAKMGNAKGIAIVGVTVLTDISDIRCAELYGKNRDYIVRLLTHSARNAGLAGIVCAGSEAADIRALWPEALIICPGIRPTGSSVKNDSQVFTSTPTEAIIAGADFLVIGRPITEAPNPLAAILAINEEINQVVGHTH